MAKHKKQAIAQEEGAELGELLEQIRPFAEAIAPHIIEYQKVKAPIIKRWQWINFTIMMTLLLSVSLLAYFGKIDGSAATGLIGAVIGYVFGGLYQQRGK